VGLVVTVGLLAWALHGVDAAALVGHLRRANPWLMLATITLATLTFPLRAIRWRLILRGTSGTRLPLGALWHATAIGFMANNLLPVRAGEVARAYAAQQAASVRFTTALASIVVERLFDGLMLVALFTLALVAPSFPRHAMIGGVRLSGLATAGAALFAGILIVALFVVHRPAPWIALLARVAHAVLPARLADRVTHLAQGLVGRSGCPCRRRVRCCCRASSGSGSRCPPPRASWACSKRRRAARSRSTAWTRPGR